MSYKPSAPPTYDLSSGTGKPSVYFVREKKSFFYFNEAFYLTFQHQRIMLLLSMEPKVWVDILSECSVIVVKNRL